MQTFPRNPTNYDLWQLVTHGNVLPATGNTEVENAAARDEQAADWTEKQAENQNWEYERQY